VGWLSAEQRAEESTLRIESLEIKNFKVLRHLELADIPNLVVIAGPNGSGKTALFDALRVFKEAIATYSVRYEGPTFSQQLLQQVGPVITIGQS
jgi:AAA15 family ATPase/GTPase